MSAMTQPLTEWKVLPHGRLTQIDDNILTVEGEIPMPLAKLPRRMTVVRLRDGRLVIFNGVALDEGEMRRLEEFGTPTFLVVPNGHHRLDAHIWKQRYPQLRVIAPAGARSQVEKVVPVDATGVDFNDPDVKFATVAGTGEGEAALEVRGSSGTTLILNDVIGNIRNTSGFGGFFLRLMGFAGEDPHIPVPVKLAMIKDKPAAAAQLQRWAALPSLTRVLVSHGSTIDRDPSGTLRKLAGSLG
jgi:hypothetical protein